MSLDILANIITAFVVLTFSSLLAIAGWEYVYDKSLEIAKRNEIFSRKTNLLNEIIKLREISIEFWSDVSSIQNNDYYLLRTATFTSRITLINNEINRLYFCSEAINKSSLVRELRKNITLDSERAYDISRDEKVLKIQKISECSDSLCDKIRLCFESLINDKK